MQSMLRQTCALLALLVACGDNDNQSATPDAPPDADTSPREVTIELAPKVGTAPFACGQTYSAMGAELTTITPRDFRIYVHDVKLIAADGTSVPLALLQDGTWQYENVALLDFEDFTGGCADGTAETNKVLRGTVPAGDYTGIAFTIGVPEAMNHVDLTTLPSPLNLTGLWWGWGFGHVFMAVVTHTDITTPQPGTNDHYFHLGSVECIGDPEMGETAVCAKPNRAYVELRGFDPTSHAITADFGAVIAKSNLATSVGCHSFSQDPCAYPFDLVGLNWYTGSQTPTTQKLFRFDP
jgi:uncharacterized repeat protein (TIGR04052 family)